MGIICDTKFFKGTHRQIHKTSFWKGLLRTLITLIIFSPFILAVIYIDKYAPYPRILFLVFVVPNFVSGFIFFAFSRLIFERCKLVASDVAPRKSPKENRDSRS